MGGWGDFKQNIQYATSDYWEDRKSIYRLNWCTNLWNLLCVAKNIFEDPTEVGKENCKIRTEDYHTEKFYQIKRLIW